MRLRKLILVFAMTLFGCGQVPNHPVDWPPMDESWGAAHCPAQCSRLEALGCPEASPTPGGITCPDSCRTLLERKVWTPGDVACVEGAKDVDGVRTCRVRCRQ